MKLLYLALVLSMLITTVYGQIYMEPEITGNVWKHYWFSSGYYARYDIRIPEMDVYCYGTGFHHDLYSAHAVMEFPADETVYGGIFPTTQMTVSNWMAAIEVIDFEFVNGPFPNLYQMNDEYEDGVLEINDFYSSTSEDLITALHPDEPGGTTVSSIDITDALRNDIFGAGAGDLTSGYILIAPACDYENNCRVDHENLRITVNVSTPTPTPTQTPTITPTPTQSPTSTPPEWRGVKLILPGSPFTAGDQFKLRAQCMGDPDDSDVNLYVILDVYGEYWFHPGWTEIPQYETVTLNPSKPVVSFILDFIWPDNTQGSVDGLYFWGAILDQETSDLIGDFDRIEFGYYNTSGRK